MSICGKMVSKHPTEIPPTFARAAVVASLSGMMPKSSACCRPRLSGCGNSTRRTVRRESDVASRFPFNQPIYMIFCQIWVQNIFWDTRSSLQDRMVSNNGIPGHTHPVPWYTHPPRYTPLPGRDLGPTRHTHPSPTDRMTDTCENITSPQFRWRAVIINLGNRVVLGHSRWRLLFRRFWNW